VKILLFGRLGDVAGWRERSLEPAPSSLTELRRRLSDEDAALGEALARPGVQIAVDLAIVRGDAALAGAREVAFLAPMSGG
jgi:molybdopterin synthase sulfur carrier subunit